MPTFSWKVPARGHAHHPSASRPFVNPELLGPGVDVFAEEQSNRDDSIPQHTIDEVEAALSEVSVWYEAHNSPEPVLFPIVNTPEGPAFQVYACSERWVAQGLLQGLLGAVFGQNATVASSPYSFCDKSGAYIPFAAITIAINSSI